MLKFTRHLRDNKSLIREVILAIITGATDRSIVPARFSTSVVKWSNDLDIVKYFEFIRKVTLQAGEIFKRKFYAEKIVTTKSSWDVTTDVDLEIENTFIDALSQNFPDHGIIAEEMINVKQEMPELTDAPTWFIDAIDGTVNFAHNFPHACISVGLTVCKEPVAGIVYEPMNSELYSAIKGRGAFMNEKPIYTSKISELKDAMMIFETTVMKLSVKNKPVYENRLSVLLDHAQAIRDIGSIAMAMAFLARGMVDCIQVDQLEAWDSLAGTVIIHEAGGIVMDTKGGPYNIMKPNIIAASTKTLAEELFKLIDDTDLKI